MLTDKLSEKPNPETSPETSTLNSTTLSDVIAPPALFDQKEIHLPVNQTTPITVNPGEQEVTPNFINDFRYRKKNVTTTYEWSPYKRVSRNLDTHKFPHTTSLHLYYIPNITIICLNSVFEIKKLYEMNNYYHQSSVKKYHFQSMSKGKLVRFYFYSLLIFKRAKITFNNDKHLEFNLE
ncbi:hypothetical protein [Ureibacillus sp. FSL K6-3587]|uniref:hypothetical protein n=1 Tax=Ureibacillus sp. FSL K6-3587 TaxID=2954681 RepID=UPI0031580313